MGKLKNAFMENTSDDMGAGQPIEERSSDALLLLMSDPNTPQADAIRAQTEFNKRYPSVYDDGDMPQVEMILHELRSDVQWFRDHPPEIELHREELEDIWAEIMYLLRENHNGKA